MLLGRHVEIGAAGRVIVAVRIQVYIHTGSRHDVVHVLERLAALVDPNLPYVLGAFARSVAGQLVQQFALVGFNAGFFLPFAVDGAREVTGCLHGARLVAQQKIHVQVGSGRCGHHAGVTCAHDQQIGGFGLNDLVFSDFRSLAQPRSRFFLAVRFVACLCLRCLAPHKAHGGKCACTDARDRHELAPVHFDTAHDILL